MTESRKPAPC